MPRRQTAIAAAGERSAESRALAALERLVEEATGCHATCRSNRAG